MTMENAIEYPVSGGEAAKFAWKILDENMAHLVDEGTPIIFYDDIRSQFALWLSTQPRKIFSSMSEAWNIFAQPKLKFNYPVILLPGSKCNVCSSVKHKTKNFAKVGYEQCPQCRGTGRKPPRAVQANYDENFYIARQFAPVPAALEHITQPV